MFFLIDRYERAKTAWRRFEQWERRFLFGENELNFEVAGSPEEFEQRLQFLVPTITKTEYFDPKYERSRFRNYAYMENGEIGLTVPNHFLSILTQGIFALFWTPAHSFFGYLENRDSQLILRGTTEFGTKISKILTTFLNVFVVIGLALMAGGLVFALWRLILGSALIEFVEPLSFISFGPIVILTGFVCSYFIGSWFWAYDRAASVKLKHVLNEVCGKPV